ncbi:MAG: VCBS repeat-containing protein, partial [Gemmatimonadetes bacterium]|nr:VCBS repeat-containing protein [Gemmatimonadota bacterium]
MSASGFKAAAALAALTAASGLADTGPDPRAGEWPAFVDVAEASGVDLLTVSGTPAKEYIVESTTGGTAVFDYDNDGDVDIFIVNGSRLGGFENGEEPRAALFRNEGDWRFTDVGAGVGVDHAGWGMGCTPADYNADGWLDLFLANYGPNALYRNSEGVFTDVASQAGIAHPGWGAAAAFADFDGD